MKYELPKHSFDYDNELLQQAQKIKLCAFDVDGVLTNGKLYLGKNDDNTMHVYDIQDGMGIKLLSKLNIFTACITARYSMSLLHRAKELSIGQLFQNVKNKLEVIKTLQNQHNVSADEIAYIGDDLVDIKVMQAVGLSVAVANAHHMVKNIAHVVTHRCGGDGAIREICDLLITAQGQDFIDLLAK